MEDRFGDLDGLLEPDEMDSRLMSEEDASRTDGMSAFLASVDDIKHSLKAIEGSVFRLRKLIGVGLTKVDAKDMQGSSDEVNNIVSATSRSIATVKGRLERLDAETVRMQDSNPSKRMRENMQATLTKKFVTLVKDFQEAQQDTRDKFRQRMVREVKVVQPGATLEDVDTILESGDPGQVFMQGFVDKDQQEHARARQQLIFITERHQDILRLERSIRELHQLFVDMAVLVHKQGELVDQIEHSVSKSVEYTEAAKKDLAKTIVSQKRGRRKKVCILVIILIALVVVLVPVIATQLK